ncbi:right-handed parallel beta-helix repeat-containing protein [Myxococcota bacterium]
MRRPGWALLVIGIVFPACGDDDSNANDNGNANDNVNTAPCDEGFLADGPACVPIFDDCPGPAEIPVLGGGCQPVGVTECAPGFETDGEGGCEPILPSEPCPFGHLAIIGHASCQPIGDCGQGTWGAIGIDATTVFVNGSADASGADGSQGAPFVTIQEAYDALTTGGQIAVAAGEYEEWLTFGMPVRLTGRCAELVTIRGPIIIDARVPIAVTNGGSGTTIRGVTLTGDAEGLAVTGAQGIVVEQVQVVDTGSYGIALEYNAEVRLWRVRVSRGTDIGAYSWGSNLELHESVVRDTNPLTDGTWGRGIHSQCDFDLADCGSLTVTGSLVAGNADLGIGLFSVEAMITGSVVRDTLPNAAGENGRGIAAQCDSNGLDCGQLDLVGSLVDGNNVVGVYVSGVETTIASSGVRGTQPSASAEGGEGVIATCDPIELRCNRLDVGHSLVAGNTEIGVFLYGVEATIAGSVVRDTLPKANGAFGRGINAQCFAGQGCGRLDLTSSLIDRNTEMGVNLFGVATTIAGAVIRDTVPNANGEFGRGIGAQCNPAGLGCGQIDLTSSMVTGNSNISVYITGAPATLSGVAVSDTHQNTEGAFAGDYGEGVFAGCSPETGACSTLQMIGCLVESSYPAGVAARAVSGSIQGSLIRQVAPRASDGAYGYGIQAEGIPGADPTVLDVRACQIQEAELAGILYYLAGGTVSGSRVASGQYTVVMNQGANPVVEDDNDLSGSIESEPTWSNMEPAPAPEPLLPFEM